MSRDSLDFRLWLRNELVADARGDAVPGERSRRIFLSDLEALALVILCVERQADPSMDGYTTDIARWLACALLARLE